MEVSDNYDIEQHNVEFLLTTKNVLETEINVIKNAQRFTEAVQIDMLSEENSFIYNQYNQSVNNSVNILAQKQVIMENVKIALITACPHCWTTDHFEPNGEDMREITYCTVCETIQEP